MRRGVTWLNALSAQVVGLGAVLVPGTARVALYLLDCLLNLDGGARPEVATSDTASYSDHGFGLYGCRATR
ncbi:Tn3 family transposase [Streptomyces sp. NPDC088253]|uniref:Tn3 family transposase n=1 Tax=Streptomyces sp. NPDC088253 TaxID=3365846 RepID=UPI003819F4B4